MKVVGAQVIIVGGGLAGLSAAHTVLENGGAVVLLDKMKFLGGNSTRATSGINGARARAASRVALAAGPRGGSEGKRHVERGCASTVAAGARSSNAARLSRASSSSAGALTQTQRALGIADSAELFEEDTLRSAAGLGGTAAPPYTPPLAKVLTHDSGPAVDWLQRRFKLDLSLVSRLGGHSQPRTHRGKERFPGFAITYALMEALEDVEKKTEGKLARILTKARVTRLLSDDAGRVVGVEYEQGGQTKREHGAVIIATGGFAADFSPDGVLASVRPDLLKLPTTNGEHCTGDGIKIAAAINAGTVDMASVQVHPTGLVHPDEPDAKVKWLAAEALRGVGGVMLDGSGQRFVDELGRRDFVSGEMTKRQGPFRLVLNEAAAREIEWHCKHYCSRGVMRTYPNASALAADIGIRPSALQSTLEAYNQAAARGSGDPFGRKFFTNAPFRMNETLHVAIITPVVHYCMVRGLSNFAFP
jgi:flavocytochrome c